MAGQPLLSGSPSPLTSSLDRLLPESLEGQAGQIPPNAGTPSSPIAGCRQHQARATGLDSVGISALRQQSVMLASNKTSARTTVFSYCC